MIFIPSPSVDINSFVEINSQSVLDIPIVHRKEKRSCVVYPLHKFLSYAYLST